MSCRATSSASGATSKSSSTPREWCHGRPPAAQPADRRAGRAGAAPVRRRGPGAASHRDHRGGDRADAVRGAGLRARCRGGGRSRRADHPGGDRRSRRNRALPRDPVGRAYRAGLELRRPGAVRRLEGDERAGADHRRRRRVGRPGAGALPALGRLRPGAARRGPPVRRRYRQLAAAGAQGGGRGLFPADRRGRLLRQPGRLHRRQRAEGGAAQAARDHGLRRREPGDADRRQRAGADAAAGAVGAAGALHELRAAARRR